jgi:hypothetical protein
MARSLRYLVFFLLGGVLLAVHLSHWLMPVEEPLVPVPLEGGWIGTRHSSPRGYFRHTLRIPFLPRHAWIAIAADDYRLYVNGVQIAQNIHLSASDNAFQDKLSAPSQNLSSGRVADMARESTFRQRSHEEWRMMQFFDIREHLTPGRNTIAVYVQSDCVNRLAVRGSVSSGPVVVEIPGQASAWRASTESTTRRGRPWFHPAYDDVDWEEAQAQAPPSDKSTFAAADPEIWKHPFAAECITGPTPTQELIFRTELPPGPPGRTGWIRVRASWSCNLFVGGSWVGRGGNSADVDAFDISRYLDGAPKQVTVRLSRTGTVGGSHAARELPWLAVDGRIGSDSVSSGPTWSYLSSYHPEWLTGGGEWRPAVPHPHTLEPSPICYKPSIPLDRRWFGRLAVMALVMGVLLATAAYFFANGLSTASSAQQRPGVQFGCWFLSPALVGILIEEALRFRFAGSDTLLFFLAPSAHWLLLTGPLLLLITFLAIRASGPSQQEGLQSVAGALRRPPPLFWLTLIILLGLGLRVYTLEFQPPTADEDTSRDAARGILHTGVPRNSAGILYTRSPLYHYLLAAWLGLFGDTLGSARSFTLLPGIAVIPAVYCLVRALSRRPSLALLAALSIASDPWLLGVVNLIRFYQQMQFFAVVATLLFLKGFIWKEGKRYQNWFFVCATGGVLSQEIFVTFFPGFLLSFLLFYRPFSWKADKNVWAGFLTVMAISLVDVFTWAIICLTPHVAVATSSASAVTLHFTTVQQSITGFTSLFFWMCNGMNLFYSAFFFAGAVYWIRHPNQAVATLYLLLLVTLASLTVLVVPVASRYCSALHPILVSVAILSADRLVRCTAARLTPSAPGVEPLVARRWRALMASLVLVAWLFNGEFNKVVDAYDRTRFLDYHAALQYVARHKRDGDRIMSAHPPEGAILLGRTDYYALVLPHFDEIHMHKHGLADRWSGGQLVWKLDQYRHIFRQHDRVWIVVDERRIQAMPREIVAYLQHTCTVEYEFFGGQVLLWDRTAGRSMTVPDRGGAVDSY